MDVFVLTAKQETGEWGPVAVVTQEHTANEWLRSGPNRDWVPLAINDLSNTGMAAKSKTEFKPVPPKRRQEQVSESVTQTQKNLADANRLLEQALKGKRHTSGFIKLRARIDAGKSNLQDLAQSVLNDYLTAMGDADPKIDSFLRYVRMFHDKEFQDIALAKYKEMFGNK